MILDKLEIINDPDQKSVRDFVNVIFSFCILLELFMFVEGLDQ